jgi:methionyl-tRNA formyltransferase
MKNKIILIGTSSSWVSSIIIENIVKIADGLNIEILAIVDSGPSKNSKYRKYLQFFISKIFNPYDNFFITPSSNIFNNSLKNKIIKITDINSREFIDLMDSMKPDYAFVVGVAHIMRSEIISKFKKVLNYHNSYLPECGGLYATSWEMYKLYDRAGFSFHYIEDETIDTGNIILQRKTKNNLQKSAYDNELAKTYSAVKYLEEVLLLLTSSNIGNPQSGGSYYGLKDIRSIRSIDSIDDVSEIIRRIKCFNYVTIGSDKITKVSKDGKITRILYLPVFIYKFISLFNLKRF